MKKFLLLLVTLLVFPVVPAVPVKAADVNFWTTGGGTFYIGQTVNVVVSANSGDTYNAVTVNVTFNNLTYLGASVVGGWIGVAGPSVSGNTISFSGALLGGSASGGRDVLSVSFALPNHESQASINSSGTIALADGSGTPVNGGGNTVVFNAINPPPPPDPAPEAVSITSASHPDQSVWYSKAEGQFSWNRQNGVTDFSYAFDQTPETDPGDESKGEGTSASFPNLKDGVYYFHIKARNNVGWGPISHFTVRVDTTPPDPFGIATLNSSDTELQVYYSSFDRISGVDKYIVTIDGKVVEKAVSGMRISKTTGRIVVDAFDKAGNKQSATLDISPNDFVEVSDEEGTTTTGFDLKSALIALALLLLLQLVIFGIYRLIKRTRARSGKQKQAAKDASAPTAMEKQVLPPASASNTSQTAMPK